MSHGERQYSGSKAYVFVACGSRKHLDTLSYSLEALRHMTQCRIIVVTDSRRNEVPISWPDLLNVATPSHFNHHQASIYLKTSLHRILPEGPCYCYLDTDVLAISPRVDDIFTHKSGPVTFAPDLNGLPKFSPYAVRCGCLEQHENDLEELKRMLEWKEKKRNQSPTSSPPPVDPSSEGQLKEWGQKLKDLLFRGSRRLKKVEHLSVDPGEQEAQRYAKWFLDSDKNIWINPEGREIHTVRCEHLTEQIASTFGIHGIDTNWQHWNGGVFLFDSESHAFLDAWHHKTLIIFDNPTWRIRDQGTLIATSWEFGLQQSRLLPREFNFIVDFFTEKTNQMIFDENGIRNDDCSSIESAVFIHIIHHFGDKTWDTWNWIDKRVNHRILSSTHLVMQLD